MNLKSPTDNNQRTELEWYEHPDFIQLISDRKYHAIQEILKTKDAEKTTLSKRAEELERWLMDASNEAGGCDLDSVGNVIKALKSSVVDLTKRAEEAEDRLARLNIVLEGYKVLAGLSDPDPFKIQQIIESKLLQSQAEVLELKNRAYPLQLHIKELQDLLGKMEEALKLSLSEVMEYYDEYLHKNGLNAIKKSEEALTEVSKFKEGKNE